jgi:penicillin-binding protein 1C
LHSGCGDITSMTHESWFVLPPVQEYYFKSRNLSYKTLPPFRDDCHDEASIASMDLIYPKPDARILIPRDFDGNPGESIFELAHRDDQTSVFWHLDGEFIGMTRKVHRLAVTPPEGAHVLTLVDENGHTLKEHFTVISSL